MSQIPGSQPPAPFNPAENKRMLCGILAIVLPFGIHRFMLGDNTGGIIRLVLAFCGIGGIISIVEGVIYLTKTDEQFYQEYVVGKKAWF